MCMDIFGKIVYSNEVGRCDFAGGEDDMADNLDLFEPLWEADEDFYEEIGEVIMCPLCKSLVDTEELIDGCLCPNCFEDLSDQLDQF